MLLNVMAEKITRATIRRCIRFVNENPRSVIDIGYLPDKIYEQVCVITVRKNYRVFPYVRKQSEAVCIAAVRKNGLMLKHVVNPSRKVIWDAVKQDSRALEYVEDQTESLCLLAVRKYGKTVKYVKNQNEFISLASIKQDSNALMFVKDQTDQLCLMAVKDNRMALKHVRDQTSKFCFEVVNSCQDSVKRDQLLQMIKDEEMRYQIKQCLENKRFLKTKTARR